MLQRHGWFILLATEYWKRLGEFLEQNGWDEVFAPFGAAEDHLGGSENLPPTDKVEHKQIVSSTRKLIKNHAYDKLFAEGAAMSLQEAVNYAIEGPPTY